MLHDDKHEGRRAAVRCGLHQGQLCAVSVLCKVTWRPKTDSVRKAFKRGRDWLQDQDYTREYDGKAWFTDEPDGQDK
jgi:hypothetical protein